MTSIWEQKNILVNAHRRTHLNKKNEDKEPKNEGWEPIEEEKSCQLKTKNNQNEEQLFESSKKFTCYFCHKIFSREDNMKRHISVCKLSVVPKGSLSQSVAPNESQKKKSLTCSLCGLVPSLKIYIFFINIFFLRP